MPSFAIEVAGEVNPLSERELVNVLHKASSSDPNQIQSGTKQLSQWEKSPGFYVGLQGAFLDRSLPVEVRYLAIIQLKNGIDKYWRKTALNAVPKDDKEVIRSRLPDSILNEDDSRLALQDALVIAKIARYEFPNDWPQAISGFVGIIRTTGSVLHRARSLLALLHVVKELSTGRLQRTRTYLQSATPEIVAVVSHLWFQLVDSWRQSPSAEEMQQSLLAIKLLRRLLVSGYEHPNRDPDIAELWARSLEYLGGLMALANTSEYQRSHEIRTALGRHVVQLSKLHHDMAKSHPAAFTLLPNSMQLVQSYWGFVKEFGDSYGSKEAVTSALASGKLGTDGDAVDDKSSTEKVALKGLLIIRACVKMVHNPAQSFKYRTPEDKEEKNRATELVRQALLSETFVKESLETMITKFFVFRESDLREWQEEPEEWEKREEGDGEDWEFSIRSCSEKLFLDLAINYKDIIVQPLLNVFYSVATPQNEDVLFKDSVYTAVGLSASVLHDQLDFDAFIRDVLVAEVQKSSPGYGIVRRRTAILLGQWISVKISEGSRPLVYQIFQHLLNADDPLNDQVVRVTAGRQFLNVANDWDFKAEPFLPYAQTILTQLMQLIGEVDLTETKMALLNTISAVVEHLDYHITPFAERIVSLLPGLWEDSGEEHLMKQAILTILSRLVNAMKGESTPLHPLVIPIIKGAVEPGSETQVYLLEDALDLWGALLAQTPDGGASDDLIGLVRYLDPIYELGSENLRKALEITESYVLVAPSSILSPGARAGIFASLSKLPGSLRPDANGVLCNLIENIIRMGSRASPDLPSEPDTNPTMTLLLDLARYGDPESGDAALLPKLLRGLRGSWEAHCTTGPNAKQPPVDGIVETDYFAVFARAIMASLDGFLYVIKGSSPMAFGSEEWQLDALMHWLLEEWFSHFENIGDPSRKKLMCLALTALFGTGAPYVMPHLQSYMNMWTDIVAELRETEADVASDSLVYGQDMAKGASGEPEAAEDVRRRMLSATDEVHNINVRDWIVRHLQAAMVAHGGEQAFSDNFLVNVDEDVKRSFVDTVRPSG